MLFTAILQHTPVWVWCLLAALIALGLSQAREREASLARVTVLPLVMVALSASGVLSAFGTQPIAFGSWGAGVGAALVFGRQFLAVRGARWSAATSTLHLPGSWLPLVLILALFCIKFFVGVTIAMTPAAAHDAAFAGLASLAYGVFSGVFLARGLSLRSLATRKAAVSAA